MSVLAPELLDLLADPVDGAPLVAAGPRWLVNPRRGVRYPVVGGIPVLVVGSGTPCPAPAGGGARA